MHFFFCIFCEYRNVHMNRQINEYNPFLLIFRFTQTRVSYAIKPQNVRIGLRWLVENPTGGVSSNRNQRRGGTQTQDGVPRWSRKYISLSLIFATGKGCSEVVCLKKAEADLLATKRQSRYWKQTSNDALTVWVRGGGGGSEGATVS